MPLPLSPSTTARTSSATTWKYWKNLPNASAARLYHAEFPLINIQIQSDLCGTRFAFLAEQRFDELDRREIMKIVGTFSESNEADG